MAAMLRELRSHEQRIYMVRDLIVQELRHNAVMVEKYEGRGWSVHEFRETLRFDKWNKHAAEWSVLRGRQPDLWQEVSGAYAALETAKTLAANPAVSSGNSSVLRTV